MQEVTVGGQSILEGGSEAGRWGGREGGTGGSSRWKILLRDTFDSERAGEGKVN